MALQALVVASMLAFGLGGFAALPTETVPAPVADPMHRGLGPASSSPEPTTYHISVAGLSATGALEFEVPHGKHSKVVVRQYDHTKYSFVGEHQTYINAPSGAAKPFMDAKGAGYATPVGGGAYVGGSLSVSKQMPYEPGVWSISYEVHGSLELGFEVTVS